MLLVASLRGFAFRPTIVRILMSSALILPVCDAHADGTKSAADGEPVTALSPNQPLRLDGSGEKDDSAAEGSILIPRRQEAPNARNALSDIIVAAPQTTAWYRSPWISLAMVLAAIGLLAMLLRRARRSTGGGSRTPLNVLSRIPLGTKQSVQLVRLGDRILLLGVTEQSISTLSEIADPTEVARLQSQCASPISAREFAHSLVEERGKYASSSSDREGAVPKGEPSRDARATVAVDHLIENIRRRRADLSGEQFQTRAK